MDVLYNRIFLDHETGSHPETKKRLEVLGPYPETAVDAADEKYLELFHTKEYVEQVRKACGTGAFLDPDTATSSGSFRAAVAAVNMTVMASEKNGFALVRPPGHHSHPTHSEGFCIFNNIAIAIANLVKQGKRVFVFDFDGHLGDGTEEFFYDSDQVLYVSLHERGAFPMKGDVDEIGREKGLGYTINLPLPHRTGDDAYMNAIETLAPAALQFKPDIVAVSAGFDAHGKDPLLHLNLSYTGYYRIGKWLRDNFTNIFATLEGGYNLDTLNACLASFLDGINGSPQRFTEDPTESTIQIMDAVNLDMDRLTQNLSKYWKF